jgi:aminoglycoside 6'-N-acetyltransferase
VRDLLIEKHEIAIRRMHDDEADYVLMSEWLTDERVLEFYKGRDNPFPLERVREKYAPRVLNRDRVVACFILRQEQPIGHMQYYPLTAAEYGLDEIEGVYGIDLYEGTYRDSWLMAVERLNLAS